jgi:hypothetical protein
VRTLELLALGEVPTDAQLAVGGLLAWFVGGLSRVQRGPNRHGVISVWNER